MNNLINLLSYGQSYWLDNLTREKITSGEITHMVTRQGLRGITTNPSIFNKAIAGSDSYDEQITSLVGGVRNPSRIYELIAIKDVQDACDIMKPVFDQSDGIDGFVSLEVSPYLARDTKGTMDEARRLFQEVDHSNCYIKIPGTREGIPAIEELLYEGIPINITLLFSVTRYAEIAEAYLRALSRRVAGGLPVNRTASVASFFLSRIDVLTDQLLHDRIRSTAVPEGDERVSPSSLLGKAGIASARLAYQKFRELFGSEACKQLEEKGAHVQRLLWASTSNKDPGYNDLRYVEPLIGRDTVNTLPDQTIKALAEHGTLRENTIEDDLDEAQRLFGQLRMCGIDIESVSNQLEQEGIRKFTESYDQLIQDITTKIDNIQRHRAGNTE